MGPENYGPTHARTLPNMDVYHATEPRSVCELSRASAATGARATAATGSGEDTLKPLLQRQNWPAPHSPRSRYLYLWYIGRYNPGASRRVVSRV